MIDSITESLGIYGLKELDAPILASLATTSTVLLIGPHGSAKTFLAERIAEYLGETFRHYNTSLLNYDDLVGYPVPDVERKRLDFIQTPGTIWNANFVLFDEISRARPEIQNKVFPIVYEHVIQGISLDELKYCWAAMNPPSDGDDFDEGIYTGSWSLDMALADRFAFILNFKCFSEMAEKDQKKIITGFSESSKASAIDKLCKRCRNEIKKISKKENNWILRYLLHLTPKLEHMSLMISGRRAKILYQNIISVIGAERALRKFKSIRTSASRSLLFSLPHCSAGRSVETSKLLLAHRAAVEEADTESGSPKAIIMSIKDPVKRVNKALSMPVAKIFMTKLVSDALGSLDMARRYAWVYNIFPRISKDARVSASTFEILSEIEGNIVRAAKEEMTETIMNGSSRWKVWEQISEATAKCKMGGKERPEHVAVAKAIFFFTEELVSMDAVSGAFKNIQRRMKE